MNLKEFRATLIETEPPEELSPALKALWHDAKGDWDTAHVLAQEKDDREGARVHAYLHRKEGDLSNASYWYRRAGQSVARGSLDREWEHLVETFLSAK